MIAADLGLPDGAAWSVSTTSAGCAGYGEAPHGHLSLWLWGITRISLEHALSGVRMVPRRAVRP